MTVQTARFSASYAPLFPAYGDLPSRVRYIIVSGGRGSGKSYAVSSALLEQMQKGGNGDILFTRYTMVAAHISIIPEFTEKLEVQGRMRYFDTTLQDIDYLPSKVHMYFRGIMQSSKNQTARLKSIPNIRIWVLDEAQELTDERQFDTIDLSLRSSEYQNLVILIWNPTDINHWLYRRFFKKRGIPWNFSSVKATEDGRLEYDPRGGDVCYIYTTYEDNVDADGNSRLSDSFLAQADRAKEEDFAYYENIFLGKPLTKRAGLIYPNWVEVDASEYPDGLAQWWSLDWGFSQDESALCRMCYEPITGTLYVREVLYQTGKLARDIAEAIIQDAGRLVHHYDSPKDIWGKPTGERIPVHYTPSDCIVYCDPARPEGIGELRRIYGISAVPAVNKDKTGQIGWMQGLRVKYVGAHIREEVSAYSWLPDKNDGTRFSDTPQDGADHAADSIRYGAWTHLHRIGLAGASTKIATK